MLGSSMMRTTLFNKYNIHACMLYRYYHKYMNDGFVVNCFQYFTHNNHMHTSHSVLSTKNEKKRKKLILLRREIVTFCIQPTWHNLRENHSIRCDFIEFMEYVYTDSNNRCCYDNTIVHGARRIISIQTRFKAYNLFLISWKRVLIVNGKIE